jgi:hypothetical protein
MTKPVAWAIVEPCTNEVIAAFPDEQSAISARPSMDHDTIPLYASPQSAKECRRIGMAWIHKDGAVYEFNADKDREETLGMKYVEVFVAADKTA